MITRITIAVILFSLPLVGRFLSDYGSGYFCMPYGISMLGAGFAVLIAPVIVGILIGIVVPIKSRVLRVMAVFGLIILSCLTTFFINPPGAIGYSNGFESALRMRAGIDQLRHCSLETLKQYQDGQITNIAVAAYWSPGDVLILTNDLPEFLKQGLFKSDGGYDREPQISICKVGGKMGLNQNCVAISWYLHGVLVGATNFTTEWNPWYCKQIAPGVYSYHGMR